VAAADGLRFDGPRIFHPAAMIDVMDVEVAEATAARPEKLWKRPICQRSFLGCQATFPKRRRRAAGHAVAAHEDDSPISPSWMRSCNSIIAMLWRT